MEFDSTFHKSIENKIDSHSVDLLESCVEGETAIAHEMAIEAYIIDTLSKTKDSIFES